MITLDKQAHLWAGLAIYGVAVVILNPFLALLPVVVAAIGKEMWDKKTHPADWYDALYTTAGGVAGLLFTLAFAK